MISGEMSQGQKHWTRSGAGLVAALVVLAATSGLAWRARLSGVAAREALPVRLIDLNSASVGDLQVLPGLGPARAEAIVALRDRRGGFRRIDDLEDVRGIGPRTVAGLRPHVRLD